MNRILTTADCTFSFVPAKDKEGRLIGKVERLDRGSKIGDTQRSIARTTIGAERQ